jgi:uncharacterized protein DUF1206
MPRSRRPAPFPALHCFIAVNSTVAKRLSRAAADPTTLLARIGFAARGLVYAMIGGFGITAALSGGRARGSAAALQWLVRQPLGGAIAVFVALGLACFAGWLAVGGFARAKRGEGKRWLLGLAMIGDALLYAGFVVVVLGVALHGGSAGETELHLWVGWLFAHPFGRVLVGLAGAGILAGGIGLTAWAWTRDVERPLALSPRGKQLTEPISRYGVTGRGASLVLIGVYLLWASVAGDPTKAHGLGGVLQDLRRVPAGWALLLLFGAAFAAAAFFDLLEAFYRRRGS